MSEPPSTLCCLALWEWLPMLTACVRIFSNVPGTLHQYDIMPWHLQATYRASHGMKPWYWVDPKGSRIEGGLWKGMTTPPRLRKGLEFVTVKDAGHMSPGDQGAAVASLVGRWLAGARFLGEEGLEL